MSFIRSLYHRIPAEFRYKYFSPILNKFFSVKQSFDFRERKIHCGKQNADKTFYVSRVCWGGGV
jgi:hypothetical protein